jgi:mannose-1-phosphate guanylyltransferase/phosphomannomutase
LQELVDALPPAHISRRDVATPWEAKGTVMRLLLERLDGERVLTVDGVKAFRGEDWALVVPDAHEPVVHVWAEAGSPELAAALSAEFASLIEEMKG